MLKIGLTGNIASGKSEVEKIFSSLGILVIDLDKITHKLYENKEIQNAILKEFKTLNRNEISKIIFDSDEKRENLNNIFHPKLKEYIINLFKQKQNEKIIVVSGALLFEAGFEKLFDKIIFVKAKKETRLKRLIKRNNISEIQAIKIINAQMDNSYKADYIIDNNSNIENLKKQINNMLYIL